MTYEDVISLGWEDRYPNSKNKTTKTFAFKADYSDYHIMSVSFGCGDDASFDLIMIKCVPKDISHNEWENSETHFYGEIKTKEELSLIMQLIGIIAYVGFGIHANEAQDNSALQAVIKRYCMECGLDITDSGYELFCEHCRLEL